MQLKTLFQYLGWGQFLFFDHQRCYLCLLFLLPSLQGRREEFLREIFIYSLFIYMYVHTYTQILHCLFRALSCSVQWCGKPQKDGGRNEGRMVGVEFLQPICIVLRTIKRKVNKNSSPWKWIVVVGQKSSISLCLSVCLCSSDRPIGLKYHRVRARSACLCESLGAWVAFPEITLNASWIMLGGKKWNQDLAHS